MNHSPAPSGIVDFISDIIKATDGHPGIQATHWLKYAVSDGVEYMGAFDDDGNQSIGMEVVAYKRLLRQLNNQKAQGASLPIQLRK